MIKLSEVFHAGRACLEQVKRSCFQLVAQAVPGLPVTL